MSSKYIPKCKSCKGTGFTDKDNTCKVCEGTGVRLQNEIDEELDDYLIASDDKLYEDSAGYINLEEEDYEV